VTPPIEIAAHSEADARRLAECLPGCHSWVVRTEPDGWTVRAQPWRNDATAVRTVLRAVASWVGETVDGATRVTMDGRTYTLAAADAGVSA
jgi:hypothetical protein